MAERPVVAHGMSSYGQIGEEAGPNALGLLDNLLAPKSPMPRAREIAGGVSRWDTSDKEAFGYLIGLDSDMACIDPFDKTVAERAPTGQLVQPWQALTACLPFSEVERHWLLGARREQHKSEPGASLERFVAKIMPAETTVISAGVRRTVRGRSLVRRWASWRREMHEFAGQGSLTTAIFLLDHLAYELAPGMFTTPEFREQYPHVAEFDARAESNVRV